MQEIDIKLSALSTVHKDGKVLAPVRYLEPVLHTYIMSSTVDASSHRIRHPFRIYSTML